MIKLHRRQNERVGKVMQKLWSLVEESSIVFIALEDEVLTLSQLKTTTKVFRNPADQERRLEPRGMKHPCQQGGRRRLAVRARDQQYLFALKKLIMKNLRQRTKPNALI